jgi:hypothetical protein
VQGTFYNYKVPKNDLWEMKEKDRNWEVPYKNLAYVNKDMRVLPSKYQAYHKHNLHDSVIAMDGLVNLSDIENTLMEADKIGRSYSARMSVKDKYIVESNVRVNKYQENCEPLYDSMLLVLKQIWEPMLSVLVKEKYLDKMSHIDSWLNDGKLDGSKGNFHHFLHYDCDEYLEFSKGLFRFPVAVAITYLTTPDITHKAWFPTMDQYLNPKVGRVFFADPKLVHGVLKNELAEAVHKRIVMVSNLWDYETRSEQIEISYGVTGYTTPRMDEIVWT